MDYRGEVGIILQNNTKGLIKIQLGTFLAQGVIVAVEKVEWEYSEDELSETQRGEGGFGHTGDGKSESDIVQPTIDMNNY